MMMVSDAFFPSCRRIPMVQMSAQTVCGHFPYSFLSSFSLIRGLIHLRLERLERRWNFGSDPSRHYRGYFYIGWTCCYLPGNLFSPSDVVCFYTLDRRFWLFFTSSYLCRCPDGFHMTAVQDVTQSDQERYM